MTQIDRLTFSKIKFESDPFSRVSSKCDRGVVNVLLLARFEVSVHESRCDKSRRHNITGCGVFLVQKLFVFV